MNAMEKKKKKRRLEKARKLGRKFYFSYFFIETLFFSSFTEMSLS